MLVKSKLVFWFAVIATSVTLFSCDKDDDINPSVVDKSHPIYVSEATCDDNKNVYFYERVEDRVRLKQVDFYKAGKKKFHRTLKYDNQNRLIEYSNSRAGLYSNDFSDYIFGDVIDTNVRLNYGSDKITITDIENDNTMVLTLNSDGFVNKIEDNDKTSSNLSVITRKNDNIITAANTYIDKTGADKPEEWVVNCSYDSKKSIDYIRVLLPALYSKNNPLESVQEDDSFKMTYSYEYNSFSYPTKITETTFEIYNGHKHEETCIKILKYIDANEIK